MNLLQNSDSYLNRTVFKGSQMRIKTIAFITTMLASTAAFAQHSQHAQHSAPLTPSQQAYSTAMDAMHGPMMEGVMDPDPDVAFVKGMIPHHQGAIDMARIVIKYGKDPEVRKLAKEVIKAQEGEIAWMNEWLKKHDKK